MNSLKKMFRNIKQSKGVTMLEMLLVLSIIAVLLILATRYYMSTSYTQRVNQLQQEISEIQAAVSNYKISDPTLTNLSASKLVSSGLIAKADLDSNNNILTPWGATINAAKASATGYATISFSDDTKDSVSACLLVANAIQANIGDTTKSSASCSAAGAFSYTFAP